MEWLKALLISIIAVFAPAKAMILTSLVLVIVDLLTGLMAARAQKKKITSSALRRTAAKLFVYEMAVILGYLTQTYLTGEVIPVASIIAGLIGITELLSCLENLNAISGNDLLKTIIDKISAENHK